MVRSATVAMPARVRIFAARAGNAAIYDPEANALVLRAVDAGSGTSAFKPVGVTIST